MAIALCLTTSTSIEIECTHTPVPRRLVTSLYPVHLHGVFASGRLKVLTRMPVTQAIPLSFLYFLAIYTDA